MLNIISNFLGFQGSDSALSESEAPCLLNTLPLELILQIFENGKSSLPALGSVNHLWKDLTRTPEFDRAMFSPAFAACCFGKADLKTHFGMDLGLDEVPQLRLKDYGAVEKGICLLNYFPNEIPIEDKAGAINWVPPRAKIIGEIVKKPKCGHATRFDLSSYFPAINAEREIKGGEWVVTYKKSIGHSKTMDVQILLAEEQGEDTDVAELEKTIYAVFMHYVKTGERCFTAKTDCIRFKEKIEMWNLNIALFAALALPVSVSYASMTPSTRRSASLSRGSPLVLVYLALKNYSEHAENRK